jgi:magnesium chelatase subunit D
MKARSFNNKISNSLERPSTSRESAGPDVYPFSAIVGQGEMKLALILNVIDPLIGGILIMGHRGTGKSTAVRALADLLPSISVVSECAYRCDPKDEKSLCAECKEKTASGARRKPELAAIAVVELPLGATEDRVCGTIDIERALTEGVKSFEPGLLARANRGFLYIDEVNLLEDHLVDLLLDVAVTGRNKVERESISIEHPARFVLIGSGNPEEGELRPQLLDRFGLHVEVKTEGDLNQRVAIIERREAFDRASEAFRLSFAPEQEQLRDRITQARKHFANVKVERALLNRIAQLCSDLKVDGHRGELTIMRASRALAAFELRKKVTDKDVKTVAVMSLRHRLRRDALEETGTSDRIEQALEKVFSETSKTRDGDGQINDNSSVNTPQQGNGQRAKGSSGVSSRTSDGAGDLDRNSSEELPSPPATGNKSRNLRLSDVLRKPESAGKSRFQSRDVKAIIDPRRGRYARSVSFKTDSARIALDATLRALAASSRRASNLSVHDTTRSNRFSRSLPDALRFKLFKRKQGTLFIFALDTSGSMALNRIAQAKGVILKLLRQSYLNRDSVAIVAFRGKSALVSLQPSRSILRARRVLDSLSMGGSTPLSAGLVCTLELVKRVGDRHGEIRVLLFTDGHANVALRGNPGGNSERIERQKMIEGEMIQVGVEFKKARVNLVVVDTQSGFGSDVDARRVAEILRARLVRLHENNG